MMQDFSIVVIGGSAGGVQAIIGVAEQLPADLNAAVFVALHLSPSAPSVLAELLNRRSAMQVEWAIDGVEIEAGTIYVAPPDKHLTLEPGHVALGRGPRENGHRPAIDPLFRTAAHVYCERVIGVVLSGNLDDGSVGLVEIRKMGGKAIVQDPTDSPYSGMPQNALDAAGADVVCPADQLADAIIELVNRPAPTIELCRDMPEDIATGGKSPMAADEREEGELSVYGCPDCGGALWEIDDGKTLRFRCRVGHSYTDESLLEGMTDGVERAMWAALRALEEQATQARQLARRMKARGHSSLTERFLGQAVESEERALIIRRALLRPEAREVLDEVS
jgi:two-component system chemotaxis response regulator CheB